MPVALTARNGFDVELVGRRRAGSFGIGRRKDAADAPGLPKICSPPNIVFGGEIGFEVRVSDEDDAADGNAVGRREHDQLRKLRRLERRSDRCAQRVLPVGVHTTPPRGSKLVPKVL